MADATVYCCRPKSLFIVYFQWLFIFMPWPCTVFRSRVFLAHYSTDKRHSPSVNTDGTSSAPLRVYRGEKCFSNDETQTVLYWPWSHTNCSDSVPLAACPSLGLGISPQIGLLMSHWAGNRENNGRLGDALDSQWECNHRLDLLKNK